MTKILLIGCGRMGGALLNGWLDDSSYELTVIDPAIANMQQDVAYIKNSEELPEEYAPDVAIIAVKPQFFEDALSSYNNKPWENTVFISIAAGKSLATLASILGNDKKIIRAMPNLPATIGKGVTVAIANDNISNQEKTLGNDLMAAVGNVHWLENESQMDAVTAISGSGPAYVFYFIECLENAAKTLGLDEYLANKLALETVYGSAVLAQKSTDKPGTLRKNVTSPGGTTEAGLKVLMNDGNGLAELLNATTGAAKKRSKELG